MVAPDPQYRVFEGFWKFDKCRAKDRALRHRWKLAAPELALLTFQSIAVGHRFQFHTNGIGDGDDGASFEREGRQHRTELMHFEWVVTFHQHIPAPITDADDERLDFEIGGSFPRAEDLQNSLLCIFVLDGRALRTFVPSDHVLHDFSPLSFCDDLPRRL